jgi:hypothetical protein
VRTPKKPAIPSTPKPDENRARFDQALRENIEIMTGRRAEPIEPLDPATATAEDCAHKINEILARLQ